jgi:undecaprenyl-diphosphatase
MTQESAQPHGKVTLIYIWGIVGLLLVFGVIAQIVSEGKSLAFDKKIILVLRDPASPSTPIGPAWVQEAARDLTSLGSIIVLVIITLFAFGYLFLAKKRAAAWLIIGAVFSGMALNYLLKLAFARPRPDILYQAARIFSSSFPSEHAELSAITYLTIAALLAQSQSSFKIAIYCIAWAALLTILIGTSRIYLGVHYPTDVLGGWCIGTAWALGCWLLMTRLQDASLNHSARPV